MKILYGITGQSMGQAARTRVILEHLIAQGHTLRVVVSGRAHEILHAGFASCPRIGIVEIPGLAGRNPADLEKAPGELRASIAAYRKVAEDGFAPDVVVSDFESWACRYGMADHLAVVSIDNAQLVHRCEHPPELVRGREREWLARGNAGGKVDGAYHYLIPSFAFPAVGKPRTTLVSPILGPEILAARREPGEHVVVHWTASTYTGLLPLLSRLPCQVRVYGRRRVGREGNIILRAPSRSELIEDLRTARALIAGAGFSLMGEAVHLHVPMLAVPLEGDWEQEINARYLAHLGYGAWTSALEVGAIEELLRHTDAYADALERYVPRGNYAPLACIDELMHNIEVDAPPPVRLEAPAMGSYNGPGPPEEPWKPRL